MTTVMAAGAALAAAAAPVMAHAAEPVRFASDVFVERFQPAGNGRTARVLERADRLRAGDRVVFVVNWKAQQGREFTVTNPMPRTVSFQGTAQGDEEVSVDGGRSWGQLGDLAVREADGRLRRATPEDVTHLRWRVPGAIAALGAGQMTYRGIVR
ncbi:hypothetical protein [Novosphingobium sp. KCTC 2891]|uniref:hypothetical protein n=1 Tax=Novosphingobium sp. KCTC 2891 TaxID=2989730 RepID=UPI002223107A|nr:hypothetical protein [Novosphingobium sp. KCTC 2891]